MSVTDKKVAVLGLGYVGLPLAALCAKRGYRVTGFDSNEAIIASLRERKCHIRDDTVERLLAEAFDSSNLALAPAAGAIADCEIYLVCVPTPIDSNNEPDLEPLQNACRIIAPQLVRGDLVVIESTVFPGTCEEVVRPLLEKLSGLSAGSDFHLAHCPERVNPGDLFWTSENIPRVVGATAPAGADAAAEFYASILQGGVFDVRDIRQSLKPKFRQTDEGLQVAHLPLGSVTKMRTIRDAEAVKAMENTVRDVNIAFVNELARISDVLELNVVDIIDGMSTKPFGKGPFYPGVGVGGHCIAVDPEWLRSASKRAGYIPEMIQLSRAINNGMPEYAAGVLQDMLNQRCLPVKGTPIAVLGVAYKRNVDDSRESPFFDLRRELLNKGAELRVYDSWVASENTVDSVAEAIAGARALVVVTEHSDLVAELNRLDLAAAGIEVVLDGRNCLDGDRIKDQDILYRGIGRRVDEPG